MELIIPYSTVTQFEYNFGPLFLIAKFSFTYGNANPILEKIRDEKNSSFVTHGTFPFSPLMAWHLWGEKNSPTRGFAARGGIFFPHACQAIRGENGNVPFVTHEEFFFPI